MYANRQDKIEDKLYKLQKACNRYAEIDPLAPWVLYALTRHIETNRATRNFEDSFLAYPTEKFEQLIKACLNGDRSDDGIIKTCKRIFSSEK